MMDPEKKRVWVDALRSGTFPQTRRFLFASPRTADNNGVPQGYCCLGVVCKVILGFVENNDDSGPCFVGLNGSWVDVFRPLGLRDQDIDTLVRMNDGGKTFSEIADWIDANL